MHGTRKKIILGKVTQTEKDKKRIIVLESIAPEKLGNKEGSWVDTQIFLGKGNRRDFVSRRWQVGMRTQVIRLGDTEWEDAEEDCWGGSFQG